MSLSSLIAAFLATFLGRSDRHRSSLEQALAKLPPLHAPSPANLAYAQFVSLFEERTVLREVDAGAYLVENPLGLDPKDLDAANSCGPQHLKPSFDSCLSSSLAMPTHASELDPRQHAVIALLKEIATFAQLWFDANADTKKNENNGPYQKLSAEALAYGSVNRVLRN